jgi:hypothetical protein
LSLDYRYIEAKDDCTGEHYLQCLKGRPLEQSSSTIFFKAACLVFPLDLVNDPSPLIEPFCLRNVGNNAKTYLLMTLGTVPNSLGNINFHLLHIIP